MWNILPQQNFFMKIRKENDIATKVSIQCSHVSQAGKTLTNDELIR